MILLAIALILIILFGSVVFIGPPYLPTLRTQIAVALGLLQLKPGQTLLELGSGDGRVALAAAKQGILVVGIEVNPLLVVISRIVTWRYRETVTIIWGSYWHVHWPPAEGIFTFMIDRQMSKLDRHISVLPDKPIRLASFAFKIPNKKPIREKQGVFLYQYN